MIVYLITNQINGKQYIGQTIRPIKDRWNSHIWDAHTYRPWLISKAIRKYGPEKFSIESLAEVNTKAEMDFFEVLFIQLMGTLTPRGYNVSRGGDGRSVCHTPETCRKISESKIGWNPSEETRHRMSLSQMGRIHTVEHAERCRLLGYANRGRVRTEEQRKRNSEAHKGQSHGPLSLDTRLKISQAKILYYQKKRAAEQSATPMAVGGEPGGPGFGGGTV